MKKPSFCNDTVEGGHFVELYKLHERNSKLSNYIVDGQLAISRFEGMTLSQYVEVREHICKTNHTNCKVCPPMIHVANTIKNYGFWKLKAAYVCSMDHVQPCQKCPELIHSAPGKPPVINAPSARNYITTRAKKKFLRMPLACVTVPVGPKEFANFLIDKDSSYSLMTSIIKQINEKKPPERTLSKDCVSNLMKSCTSDSERERLRYALSETSNLSKRELRRQ